MARPKETILSTKDKRVTVLDFVYRLRNALFHEIIDPLDEEWQIIFKNAYLVLKEIVDLNIAEIQTAQQMQDQELALSSQEHNVKEL